MPRRRVIDRFVSQPIAIRIDNRSLCVASTVIGPSSVGGSSHCLLAAVGRSVLGARRERPRMADLQTHHVGTTVRDLDRAVDFYRDILGLSVAAEFEVAGDAFETVVDIAGASARFAHLDGGSARIELVEYEPPADGLPTPQLNDAGATHLGLEVDDLDA